MATYIEIIIKYTIKRVNYNVVKLVEWIEPDWEMDPYGIIRGCVYHHSRIETPYTSFFLRKRVRIYQMVQPLEAL